MGFFDRFRVRNREPDWIDAGDLGPQDFYAKLRAHAMELLKERGLDSPPPTLTSSTAMSSRPSPR